MSGYDIDEAFPDTDSTPLLHRNKSKVPQLKNDGYVTGFAAFGVFWTIIALQAWIRWLFSNDFTPAPLLGPDTMATWRLVMLRITETASLAVWIGFFWFCIFAPLFKSRISSDGTPRKGQLSLDGKFVIGGMVAWAMDGFLDCQQYIFSWNAHNVNMGVWTRFIPFHREGGPHRYGESLLWGPPMYIYFCAGVAMISCAAVRPIRRRWPNISDMTLVTIIWIGEFIFDFVLENVIIRTTHGYGFPKTYAPLTLWPGKVHQYPIYESILVASLGSLYSNMRMRALDDPEGLSPVEKGYERWPKSLQGTVRTFAVIGFCAAATLITYHLPPNWLGIIGTSKGDLPSYMLPGGGLAFLYPCNDTLST